MRRALLPILLLLPLAGCFDMMVDVDETGGGTARIALDMPAGESRQPFAKHTAATLFSGGSVTVESVQSMRLLDRRKIWIRLRFQDIRDFSKIRAFAGMKVERVIGSDRFDLDISYPAKSVQTTPGKQTVRVGFRLPGIVRRADGRYTKSGRTVVYETDSAAVSRQGIEMHLSSGLEYRPLGPGRLATRAILLLALLAIALLWRLFGRGRQASVYLVAGGFATLCYEVLLTRLFSALLWYHFAFMAISLALLGQTAGASLVAALGPRRRKVSDRLSRNLLLIALTTIVTLWFLVRHTAFAGSTTSGFASLFLVASLPFLFFGAATARLFAEEETSAGTLYFANLLGAALGTLAAVPLLSLVGADSAILFAATLTALVALLISKGAMRGVSFAVLLLLAFLTVTAVPSGPLTVRSGKNGVAKDFDLVRWNTFSMITLGREFASSWGLSPKYRGPHAPSIGMEIDLNAFTPIVAWKGAQDPVPEVVSDVTSLVDQVKNNADVLVIGAGGGKDVLAALQGGARHVTAVELNPLIASLVKDRFAHFTGGLYSHPKVDLLVMDGRRYIDRPGPKFDIIQASLVDTWAASASGAFTLAENHLYTIEAVQGYLRRLKPGGILSISRWHHDPPRESLRLLNLSVKALESEGADHPLSHIAVAVAGRIATFLVARDPLSEASRHQLGEAAGKLGFPILFGGEAGDDDLLAQGLAGKLDDLASTVSFDISPPTDNRPFFFHTVRRRDYLSIPWHRFRGDLATVEAINSQAVWVVLRLFGISVLASLVLIFGPLVAVRKRISSIRPGIPLLYFSALGTAFVFVMNGNVGRLSVLFGSPTVAFVTLTFGTLVGASLGAAVSSLVPTESRHWLFLVPLSVAIVTGLLWNRPDLGPITVGTILAVQGFLMGMPFPRGIDAVKESGIVPWAFAVNGASSVVAGSLSLILALLFGFSTLLLLGFFLYVAAAALYLKL